MLRPVLAVAVTLPLAARAGGPVFFGIHFDQLPPLPAYAVIFLLVAVEYTGIPSPGEAALIFGALLAATTHRIDIVLVILTAAVASFVGANIGFAVGYFGGSRLLLRVARWLHIKESRLKIARYLFNHYGLGVVVLGRFVAVLRAYVSLLAGVNRMPYGRFEVANVIGAVAWSTVWGLVYFEGGQLLERYGPTIRIAVIAGALAVLIAGFLLLRANESRLAERAEAELPGPLDFGPHRQH